MRTPPEVPAWVEQGIAWRNSLRPAAENLDESNSEPRVFNISVSSPADAARQLNRIWNNRKLLDNARQSPPLADAIDAPLDLPVQREMDGYSDPDAKEKLAEKRSDRPRETDNPIPTAPTVPEPPKPAVSTPPSAPSVPSPKPIPMQELGILPGGTYPATKENFPEVNPNSVMPVIVTGVLGSGATLNQETSSTNGIKVTETTANVPGFAPIVTTEISEDTTVEVVVECTVPVPLPAPGVIPPSITDPKTIFRTNSTYSSQQLDEDLRTYEAGRVVWAGPGSPPDYDAAQARLAAAMYTPGEQLNDLLWTQHTPRNQAEIEQRFAAVQRLNQAGIPWLDPTIATWIAERQKVEVASNPFSKVDNTAPSIYSPAELRQQFLEASRTRLTANDVKQGINDFLVASTVGPAIVLWDAAHDRGDHSGAEIAWAAAELGINTVSILPGIGTLTGAAAKAGLRRVAPKLWEAMTSADNAVDAARAARAVREQELADAVNNRRPRPTTRGEVPTVTGHSPVTQPEGPVPAGPTPPLGASAGENSNVVVETPIAGLERRTQTASDSQRLASDATGPTRVEISPIAEVRMPVAGLHRGGLSGIDEDGWRSVFPDMAGRHLDDAVERARLEVVNRNDISRIQQSVRDAGIDIDASILREIKQYNFNSRGLQFSAENYNAWTRLGNGTASVGDVRYIVHEAAEIRALRVNERETGFDFMGGSWSRMSPAQQRGWEARFNEAYMAAHSEALREEYKFLTDIISDVTNGNIRIKPEVAAAIDRRPEARKHMLVGEVVLKNSPRFDEWRMMGEAMVTLTGSGAVRLGLARGTRISQAELLQRIKYLRVGSWR
ncbi:hypothetical protein [Nocardia lasii]|uniref:Uncharacterized protein n=1 Tax=Nocardia lasii TaxID=1616107 RepID=A0ABW1JQ00_9NOCA